MKKPKTLQNASTEELVERLCEIWQADTVLEYISARLQRVAVHESGKQKGKTLATARIIEGAAMTIELLERP